MADRKSLMMEAKKRGLKGYSTLQKNALRQLLELDDRGQAPAKHMTNKRKKELSKVRESGLTLEEEENFQENPLLAFQGQFEAPRRPTRATLRPSLRSGQIPPRPIQKPPRVSRAMLMKRVRQKKQQECAKYKNLSKKSMRQLRDLL